MLRFLNKWADMKVGDSSAKATFADLYTTVDEQTKFELDERAAIYEFDGKLGRAEAEARTAAEWRKCR